MYFKIDLLSTIHVNQSQELFDKYFQYDLEEQNNDEDDEVFTTNFMKIKILYSLDLVERWVMFRSWDPKLDISGFFKLLIFHIDRFYGSTQHFNVETWSDVIVKVAEIRKDFKYEELIKMWNALSVIQLNCEYATKTFISALAKLQSKIIEKETEIKDQAN